MAVETLYATSHITGAFTNPANAVGAQDGLWAGDLNLNSNYTSRWAMGDPVDPLTAGATQTVSVFARKGTNSGVPNVTLNIYQNGTLVHSGAAQNVTSTTGEIISQTFPTSAVTDRVGVEVEVVQISAGGSLSQRNSAQIDYIQWNAETTTPTPPTTPTGLTATVISETQIDLDWNDVVDATSYELDRDLVSIYTGATSAFSDTTVAASTTYSYRVRAVNNAGTSAWSEAVTATTPAPNQLPTAHAVATPNPTPNETDPIALDGTGSSDPDGTIASYQWELISAPAGYTGTFDTPSAATCIFTPALIVAGVYNESFNAPDSSVLGPDLTWTEITNDLGIYQQQLNAQLLGGGSLARAEHDVTVDHYVAIDVNTYLAGDARIMARMDQAVTGSSTTQNYFYMRWTSLGDVSIEKLVNGTGTVLASGVNYPVTGLPVRMKIECIGTAIKVYLNDVLQLSVTDPDLGAAGNAFGGVRIFLPSTATTADVLLDNFTAAEIV